MSDKITKNPLFKAYLKLPLWAKVAVPAVLVVIVLSLIKSLGLIIKVGILAVVVLGILTLVNNLKKKD